MLNNTILSLLSLFPRGATSDQLIWRLRISGRRLNASEILSSLQTLSERGEILSDSAGRWRILAATAQATLPKREPQEFDRQNNTESLRAVAANCVSLQPTSDSNPIASEKSDSLPDWSALLGYYAATQRQDPRGEIEEFSDRHGAAWQLFHATGHWWQNAKIQIDMHALPPEFREALSHRKVKTAAIGWPVSVFKTPEGRALLPGLLLPCDWQTESEILSLRLEDQPPTLNPAWLRQVRRNSSWNETDLIDRLFPEGEDVDLAAVGDRIKHALATLGGGALQAAKLATDLNLASTGLHNAAALFLPEDRTFTKGAADDLETLRDWKAEVRSGTALEAVLAGGIPKKESPGIPLLPPGPDPLTDSQTDAANAALDGPITVIQGPPGTGKSQVILSLIISAVLNKHSVLLAAKNHQAVDEIERRLKEIVPDAPLLTRGRDAEGERDTNFLAALSEIAHGDTQKAHFAAAAEISRRAIVDEGSILNREWSQTREVTIQHVHLSELVERLDFLTEKMGVVPKRTFLARMLIKLLSWATGFRQKRSDNTNSPLPETASIALVEAKIAHLRKHLSARPSISPGEQSSHSIDAAALAGKIRTDLPKIAAAITEPDEEQRIHLAQRAKQLEFGEIKTSRRMPAEDAQAVIQHRPIWAISTLSVPSRIPLIPKLFDYVIFDEASQCDIASALPLFARARNAVIVGDPMQLRFVPPLGNATEHALMDASGLPQAGRATIAESINSLFDFCESRPVAERMFLADQFRSSPAIVDYLNSDFYSGKLIGRREDEDFKAPKGYKPGIAWEDVTGRAVRKDGGTINISEASEITKIVQRIANDKNFEGSVGVVSPFNSQVAQIQTSIQKNISEPERNRLSLRVSTIDKFQGGEADVILFSLVLAPGAPASARTFLRKERRRLNVAISRARALSIIVGDLSYAQSCGIKHIEYLAQRAIAPWSPPKPQQFDSSWERRLDNAMRERGIQPHSQFPVGTRYLDFAIDPEGAKLDVEVDGKRWHTDASGNRKVGDRLRDSELRARGWAVLRFWVHELAYDMEGCLDRIEAKLGRC